jgi:hypothetical protein
MFICLKNQTAIFKTNLTVTRTSGKIEDGWRVPISGIFRDETAHARFIDGEWEIWTCYEQFDGTFLFAWRNVEDMCPTELYGNEEATEAWRIDLLEILVG